MHITKKKVLLESYCPSATLSHAWTDCISPERAPKVWVRTCKRRKESEDRNFDHPNWDSRSVLKGKKPYTATYTLKHAQFAALPIGQLVTLKTIKITQLFNQVQKYNSPFFSLAAVEQLCSKLIFQNSLQLIFEKQTSSNALMKPSRKIIVHYPSKKSMKEVNIYFFLNFSK